MKCFSSLAAALLLRLLHGPVVVAVRVDIAVNLLPSLDEADVQHGNLVDILGSLPPVEQTGSLAQTGDAWSTAVCSTGHLRTFGLHGMYSNLLQNLLKRKNTDLYLVGHFGTYKGSAQAGNVQDNIQSKDDASLKKALSSLGVDHHRTQLGASDCQALKAAWKEDGKVDRHCEGANAFKMQMYWVDHCIDLVKKSGRSYDVLVRTRPDVGVFAPMPWSSMDLRKVNFMPKDAGGKADYFFTVPMALVHKWWDGVLSKYADNGGAPPDYVLFENHKDKLHQAFFPAAIVRGAHNIECFRLVDDHGAASKYRHECDQAQASGKFGDVAATV